MASQPIPISQNFTREEKPKFAGIDERISQELIVALVGPVGSGCSTAAATMAKILADDFDYDPVIVTLSSLIKEHSQEVGLDIVDGLTPNDRVDSYQNVGNTLRKKF